MAATTSAIPDATINADPASADRRYVLPEDAPYLKNLEVLWTLDADLARRIEAIDEPYPAATAKTGVATIALPASAGGRVVQLHSKYDPIAEADRLVSSASADKPAIYYVHGFGLGYHVEALAARSGDEAPIFVFEPDLRLLRTAFELRDFSKLLSANRLGFFTTLDKAALLDRLQPHLAMFSLGTTTIEHGPSLQVAPEFHAQYKQWLAEFASFARTSLNTFLLNSAKTAENIARNIGWYVASPCMSRLKDRFAGRPAIIVSAGPSLRKNKHLLPAIQDKAVIIAVQTTLKPLLEMGIEPHFVTSLDYHEICTRFFENLPKTYGDGRRRLRTELVAEPKATSRIFAMLDGNVSLLGSNFAESLLREMKPNKAKLPPGATVAHLAYYLAEWLGCDPIIFLGQDLGFSDGLCYAPGTSYEDVWRPEFGRFCTPEMKQWDQIVRERFILRRIPDFQGRPMYTEERLFTYLQQFERDFLQSKRTIIDATEGGAAKRGAKSMPLADAIDAHCQESFPVDLSDHGGSRWDRTADCAASLRKRRDEAAGIEDISRQTLPLLETIRDHINDQNKVNQAITKIDALRAEMNRFGATYDLVTELTQKSQLSRFEADRRIKMAKLDPTERQRRQVDRDIANVRSVMEAAARFAELMDEVAASLQSDQRREVASANARGAALGSTPAGRA
ncbi:motility associated factor glycosyltransferase family protein [Humisphaera borealis]|uniref:Motility associated factor glycosyltransferase family protein n=1 Tax=Humisphaera borealis TaxID=2807512 RepID=A0A7M2WVV5_9BACT|nr:6-hydroxymethylpterin diphosphokinase MptE-like protein [Humisphaera borealis]QOV88981.1 motility associated factor glycosyltransferase family protein [Humisphaera borealis]